MADRKSLVEALRYRVRRTPDRTALIHLRSDGNETTRISYAELDRRIRRVAAALQAEGLEQRPVVLVHPSVPDFLIAFLGCLYARAVAVPAPLPQDRRHLTRLAGLCREAEPAALLTTSSALRQLTGWATDCPEIRSPRRIATDSLDPGLENAWHPVTPSGEDLAMLQFTSGSVGRPRGVMLTHDHLRWNSRCLSERFGHTEDSVMVTWLPAFHDMGLIYSLLEPVFGGFPCVTMSPFSFLRRPVCWLEAISRYGGTHSAAPNFAYELCLKRVGPEQRARLSLATWRVALNGSETVRPRTLERFSAAFHEAGFRAAAFNPSYGLAEATVMVSGGEPGRVPVFHDPVDEDLPPGRARRVAAVGRPARGLRVLVVDPTTRLPLPAGRIGEIWVAGPSVARGYWKRAEETRRTFGAVLAGTGEGPFLRTGDLGFFAGDQLCITGRLKELIVVAGRNHYPQDIELTVEISHTAIRSGAVVAFSVDGSTEEQAVVVAGVARTGSGTAAARGEIVGAIRQSVAEEHELRLRHVLVVPPGAVPKTSSGKLQRRLCRKRFLAGDYDPYRD